VTVRRALLVGLDGVRLDRLAAARAPVLRGLAAGGLRGAGWVHTPAEAAITSGPCWATVLTGHRPGAHGVTGNDLPPAAGDRAPDLLRLARAAAPDLRTFAAAAWAPLVAEVRGGPLVRGAQRRVRPDAPEPAERDRLVVDAAVREIAAGAVDVAFVHLDHVDAVGHATGTGTAYAAAIEAADAEVGRLLAAVRARAGEDWLVVVTNDHGHADGGGHGAGTRPERRWWVVAAGTTVPAGMTAVGPRPVDVAPTVLAHLGLPVPAGLAGRPLGRGPLRDRRTAGREAGHVAQLR
jgi:arylsulfatase A-like enzyme